ncbi:MAG: T9SS type A sorting domain-containing protein [Saprospiraceae bacterium]|nr:T9SS type A sorting domain-containing protein [Candidatus Brachybacter algidus]
MVNPIAATTTPNFNPVNNSPALSGANFADNPILSSFISATEEIEKATKATTIFPNPIRQGELNFGQNVASFGVFDSNANLILSGFNASSVNIDRLNNGMYFVKFNGQVQKFIVIK